ncbi:MAG: LolA family protein, partial [Planctomycetota bacterium]
MKRSRYLVAAAALLVTVWPARAASKKLAREEVVALFTRLAEAAKTAKTFQAKLRRVESTGLVIDAKPLVSEGRWYVQRLPRDKVGEKEMPVKFRQDVQRPHKGAIFINGKDFWVSFPESREAQYTDLTKGSKGSNDTLETFALWLYFDLKTIEKGYRVKVRAVEPLKGVTVRKGESGPEVSPEKMYRMTFVPLDEEKATFLELKLWLDGVNPWPLRTEKETDDGSVTREFSEIVLDAPIDPKLFEYEPPRGTK